MKPYITLATVLSLVIPSASGPLDSNIGVAPFVGPPVSTAIAYDLELKSGQENPRVVPKTWGRLVSVTVEQGFTFFYFEAPDGTIRRGATIQPGVMVARGTWERK